MGSPFHGEAATSPHAGYAGSGGAGKHSLSPSVGAARDVADPKSRLEAAILIEAMHAGILPAALQQDVVTIPGPGCCQCRANNGASMALTPKLGVADHIFEKAVPPSATQEIWRRNQHAGRNNPVVYRGHENGDTVLRQYVEPNSLCSVDRLGTGAYFRDSKELEQRCKVGGLGKPGIGHLNTGGVNRQPV